MMVSRTARSAFPSSRGAGPAPKTRARLIEFDRSEFRQVPVLAASPPAAGFKDTASRAPCGGVTAPGKNAASASVAIIDKLKDRRAAALAGSVHHVQHAAVQRSQRDRSRYEGDRVSESQIRRARVVLEPGARMAITSGMNHQATTSRSPGSTNSTGRCGRRTILPTLRSCRADAALGRTKAALKAPSGRSRENDGHRSATKNAPGRAAPRIRRA